MTALHTERLLLRAPQRKDARRIVELAGDLDVARMTARIPHPYTLDDAIGFIEKCGDGGTFAILNDGEFIGCCSATAVGQAEMEIGYWIGRPFWGQGFATEAAEAVISYIGTRAPENTILCSHATDNLASRRVIAKLGFRRTGRANIFSLAKQAHITCLTYELRPS